MITLEEAKELKYGDILHDRWDKRWKVNGAVKLWKKDASRIYVPLKHGLYAFGALTEMDFHKGICDQFTKGEPPPKVKTPTIPPDQGEKGGNV
jgi:hypothetical protein